MQIIPKDSRECYQIDITDIPDKLQTDINSKYLLSIIDTFSKIEGNYVLANKRADTVLGFVKDFISKNGKPKKFHSENGKEFRNKLFEDYCKKNEISFVHGRHHRQSRGTVESYNKEIKRLLEVRYLENPKFVSIYKDLPDVINIYNENIHSSTKFKPNFCLNLKIKILKKRH